jgi:hypothetical protein
MGGVFTPGNETEAEFNGRVGADFHLPVSEPRVILASRGTIFSFRTTRATIRARATLHSIVVFTRPRAWSVVVPQGHCVLINRLLHPTRPKPYRCSNFFHAPSIIGYSERNWAEGYDQAGRPIGEPVP